MSSEKIVVLVNKDTLKNLFNLTSQEQAGILAGSRTMENGELRITVTNAVSVDVSICGPGEPLFFEETLMKAMSALNGSKVVGWFSLHAEKGDVTEGEVATHKQFFARGNSVFWVVLSGQGEIRCHRSRGGELEAQTWNIKDLDAETGESVRIAEFDSAPAAVVAPTLFADEPAADEKKTETAPAESTTEKPNAENTPEAAKAAPVKRTRGRKKRKPKAEAAAETTLFAEKPAETPEETAQAEIAPEVAPDGIEQAEEIVEMKFKEPPAEPSAEPAEDTAPAAAAEVDDKSENGEIVLLRQIRSKFRDTLFKKNEELASVKRETEDLRSEAKKLRSQMVRSKTERLGVREDDAAEMEKASKERDEAVADLKRKDEEIKLLKYEVSTMEENMRKPEPPAPAAPAAESEEEKIIFLDKFRPENKKSFFEAVPKPAIYAAAAAMVVLLVLAVAAFFPAGASSEKEAALSAGADDGSNAGEKENGRAAAQGDPLEVSNAAPVAAPPNPMERYAIPASPVKTPPARTKTANTAAQKPAAVKTGVATYKVKPGDTLTGICKKTYGDASMRRIKKIVKENRLASADNIKAGMTLKLSK